MRVVNTILKLQPVQVDTVELVPNSSIQGAIGAVSNVIGTTLSAQVTLTKNALPLTDGQHEIVVTLAGAANTGKYKVVNVSTGVESVELTCGTTEQTNIIPGVTIKVNDLTSETVGNKCAFGVLGDQTYIIPGTVVGKIASGTHKGKWRAVRATDTLDLFTQFRVCSTFQETDKSKTVLPAGYESNLSTVFTIDVVVYGQIYESACNEINLTAVSGLKAKMSFYAWL